MYPEISEKSVEEPKTGLILTKQKNKTEIDFFEKYILKPHH